MKTRFLGLAVVFVALAVLVNVLALSTATVNSDLTVDVVNTTTALVALTTPIAPAVLDSDVAVSTASGIMAITLDHGLQPDSTYVFKSVFSITNNSDDAVNVTLSTTGTPAGMTITFKNLADDTVVSGTNMLAAGTMTVYMEIVTADTATIQSNPITVVLSATKA